jgi:hypothetical protein
MLFLAPQDDEHSIEKSFPGDGGDTHDSEVKDGHQLCQEAKCDAASSKASNGEVCDSYYCNL